MKTKIKLFSGITLLFFIMAACGGPTSRTDTRDNLADVREDMQEVIQTIDEALATNDISDFKSKTDDVISSLNSKIDDFIDEMDNADRKIENNSRNQIIEMKQKKVELEFKLALLEQDDSDNWGDGDRQDRTGTRTDMRTGDDLTGTGARQTTTGDNLTGTGARQTTTGDNLTGTGARQTTTGDNLTGARQTGDDLTGTRTTNDRNQRREIVYGPELVNDMKNDLRDLKGQVQQFSQSLPTESAK